MSLTGGDPISLFELVDIKIKVCCKSSGGNDQQEVENYCSYQEFNQIIYFNGNVLLEIIFWSNLAVVILNTCHSSHRSL